ncbi:MAG: DUF3307 domain-containing protein [Pseudomonadota bacterium]
MDLFTKAFWLIALHFVADFHLQSDFVAKNKLPGSVAIWPWVMTAHAALHGAMVGAILGPVFGIAEFAAHWLIDHAKGRGWLGEGQGGFILDQSLHLGLKAVWLGLFYAIA